MLTVVIPALNAEATIGEQLGALATQEHDGPWEVVVADNGSSDGTRGVAESYRKAIPELRIVDASNAPGGNHARNVGIAAARGDRVALCDADDVVQPGWLSAIDRALDSAHVVGGPIVPLDESARALGLRRQIDGLPVSMGFLPYAFTGNCGLRKSAWSSIGGFDESFVAGGDEIAFCWRLQLEGRRLAFAPDAVVAVRSRDDWGAEMRRVQRFGLAQAHLYSLFREHGVGRDSTARVIKEWMWLIARAPLPWLNRTGDPVRWRRRMALRLGRLVGSARYRVIFL